MWTYSIYHFTLVCVCVRVCATTGVMKVHPVAQCLKPVWSGAPQTINLEPVIALSPSDADFPWQVHFKRLESCPTQTAYG